ncbi:MAG: nucleoside triphosphate pyrophosphatase [Candidatus Omnitrophota bacterium]
MKVILASLSERRSRILSDCGIEHQAIPSGAFENIDDGKDISEIVQINAERKAEKVAEKHKDALVIGADTLVIHAGNILGKPDSEHSAREMLKQFSGEELEVYSGLCVINGSKKSVDYEKSVLNVVSLTNDQIERYFRLLGPYDKAGGFSIEGVGSILFDNIKGSYFNILGLSTRKLKDMFREIDLDILDFIKADE